jgi:hypothetical protein
MKIKHIINYIKKNYNPSQIKITKRSYQGLKRIYIQLYFDSFEDHPILKANISRYPFLTRNPDSMLKFLIIKDVENFFSIPLGQMVMLDDKMLPGIDDFNKTLLIGIYTNEK